MSENRNDVEVCSADAPFGLTASGDPMCEPHELARCTLLDHCMSLIHEGDLTHDLGQVTTKEEFMRVYSEFNAAPDLLAALEPFADLLEAPDSMPCNEDGLCQLWVSPADVAAARAAIAKARAL